MSKVEWNGEKVKDEVNQGMIDFLEWAAILVEGKAKRLCPVGKSRPGYIGGTLRGSITHEVDPDGKEARVGTNVHYAPYVELGTRKMAARPYLRPGLWENIPRIQSELKKRFEGK